MRFYRCLLLLNALALRVCLVAIGVWAFADGVGFAQNTDENGPIMTLSRTGEPIGDVSRARTERLERYEVDPENRNLRSVDGVVYSKDMKKLLAVPKKYPVKDFIIPSGVETIEEGAFSGCLLVESVSTPESLKEIGDLAFAECRSLRSVVLSEGVVSIGSSAFEACCALTSVQAPKSLKTIGSKAFFDCTTLESIFIPEGVRSIGSNAFFRCYSLASFDVAEGNERYKSVDGVLFSKGGKTLLNYPIASKRKSYSIPEGVETIGEDAFWHCATLETVYLPESVKKIGPSGFCYCLGLKTIYLPEAIEEIGRMAFSMCPSLGEIAVPRKVEKIADYAFKDCASLRRLELSENVKSIGELAFYDCKSLTIVAPQGSFAEEYAKENDVQFEPLAFPREVVREVFIPKDVQELDRELVNMVFGQNVERIDVDPENPSYRSVDGVLLSKDGKTLIKVPEKRYLQEYVVPSDVTTIGDMCFNGNYIQTITIPASVETVSSSAFGCVPTLWKFNVAEDNPNYKSIDGVLFSKDGKTLVSYPSENPRTVYVAPEGTTTISDLAFSSCNNLTNIRLSEGVETIGKGAFDCCYSLTDLELPQSLKKIDDGAFMNCLSLRNLRVPDGVSEIGAKAFETTVFSGLPVPDTQTVVKTTIYASKGSYAEQYAKENGMNVQLDEANDAPTVSELILPKEQNVFDSYEFSKIVTNENLERIEVDSENEVYRSVDGVLYTKDMKTLVKVPSKYEVVDFVVPESVTSIGSDAFSNCARLKSVALSKNVETISPDAFLKCVALTAIDVSAENERFKSIDGALLTKDGKTLLCVPAGTEREEYVVPDGVETIGAVSFAFCASIESLVVPEGVKRIENLAFFATAFERATLPGSVEVIDRGAFRSKTLPNVRAPKDSYVEEFFKGDGDIKFEPIE